MCKLVDQCNIKHFSSPDAIMIATVFVYGKPALIEEYCSAENGTKKEKGEISSLSLQVQVLRHLKLN